MLHLLLKCTKTFSMDASGACATIPEFSAISHSVLSLHEGLAGMEVWGVGQGGGGRP